VPRINRPAARVGAGGELLRSVPSLMDPRYSQSLERGLAVLGCFTAERPVRGIAEIADELGMSRSTTHRYVITLVALGYLEQGASRKYRLGLRVADLGMSALNSTGLREHSRPILVELRDRTGYTVSLAVLDGAEILYVDRAPGFRRVQVELTAGGPVLGLRLPAYCTAMGKLLLAHLPEREQARLVSVLALPRLTASTITSKRALRSELARVREDGIALSDRELAEDRLAVAVGVRGDSGEVVAALEMTAPASMLSLEQFAENLSSHLIAAADRISARLGYRRADELARG
jgi:IclR family pca regulon transcriptional regulator